LIVTKQKESALGEQNKAQPLENKREKEVKMSAKKGNKRKNR
jgi:hypothetical protein